MVKLLERSVHAADKRLLLLAPPESHAHPHFLNVDFDPRLHCHLTHEMQRLRGGVYLEDGAIAPEQLSRDGRHHTPEDQKSWHLLMLDAGHRVTACVWYLEHGSTASIRELRARNCPLIKHEQWSHRFRTAVKTELAMARRDRLRYVEIGGWAVNKAHRGTGEGLVLALAAYSLGGLTGGALGLTTATVRHGSSTILRRLGGSPLEAMGSPVPAYYDPHYQCDMELLRFDSRRPSPQYAGLVDQLTERLAYVPVIASTPLAEPVVYADTLNGAEVIHAA